MRNATLVSIVFVLFTGDVLSQAPREGPQPLSLSLKRAIEVALTPEGNPQIQLAEQGIKLAQARADQARAALMPDFEGSVNAQNLTRNLASIGFPVQQNVINGLHIPDFVGPYSLYDARINLSQNLVDLSLRQRLRASRGAIGVATAEEQSTKDQVAGQVAKLYLWAVRTNAMVDTAKANVALAETLLKSAEDKRTAGVALAIETTRAQVQLANTRQQLLVAEDERVRTHLNLLKALNLDLGTPLDLTDGLTSQTFAIPAFEQAMADAAASRSDYRAQEQREANARMTYHASELERLPSIHGIADYGSTGTQLSRILPTRTMGISVNVPVFDGGRRKARLAESTVTIRQEEIRSRDLHNEIELGVRLALNRLQSAEMQIRTAQEGMKLAEEELAHALRRYESGVTTSPETTDAQNRVERARDNYTDALFNYNAAHVDLLVATGKINDLVR